MRPRQLRIPKFVGLASMLVALVVAFVLIQGSDLPAQEPSTPIDPGPGTEHIDPALWAALQRHADGDTTVPAMLDVQLTMAMEQIEAVKEAITDAGGTATPDGLLRLPTARLLSIIQMPGVVRAEMPTGPSGQTDDDRAAMNDTLRRIVQAHEGGVPASAAVQYALFVDSNHRVFMTIATRNATNDSGVREWLSDRDIYTPPSKQALTGRYRIYAMLSLPDAIALADEYTGVRMAVEDFEGQGLPLSRVNWPQEARDFENDAIRAILRAEREAPRQPARPAEPPDDLGPDEIEGPTGASTRTWEFDLTARREAHGVDRWHDLHLRGARAKIGIIDWGFNDIFQDPAQGRGLTTTTDWNNLNVKMFCQPEEDGTWPYGALTGLTSAQPGPRKQRRHGFARPRLTPTHRVEQVRVEHVMANCPDCGAHRSGGWTQRTREVSNS